jgi:hypothetical protein
MGARVRSVRERFRRGLLISGAAVTVFGVLHHVDHVIRGNHSGWPFQEAVTPFTFSLLIYALLLPGLYLTGRGRLIAGYWLFVALVGLALVFGVHFIGEEREAPMRDIYEVYGSPATGLLVLAVLAALLISLVALAITAFRARQGGLERRL